MSLAANPDMMYRLLIQSVADYAIYQLTPEGIVANWNPGAQRAKGYRAEEIIGQHFSVFYTDEDRHAGLPARSLDTARNEGRFQAEGLRQRKDGSHFWTSVVIEPIKDELSGQLIGYAKITRDISERRQHELELLKAKELAEQYSQEMTTLSQFLDSVIANIPASVIVQDLQSQRILLANQQAERLFGRQGTRMVGQLPRQCLVPAAVDYLEQQLARGARSTKGHAAETRVDTASGPRTLRSRATICDNREGQGDYVLFVAEDATEELAAHAQIHHMAHHDTLARLGGDEFAVVLSGLETCDAARITAQRLIEAICPPFHIEGHQFSVGVSIGVAVAPDDHHQAEQLLGYADMALYEAKRNGRNRYECFHVELDVAARQRRLVETDLRTALHLGQLQLHYQPVVDQQSATVTGYEALLRWEHPSRGMIMPMDFIPIAEETGLIHEIGARALNLACQEAASWGTTQTVSVNLSAVQFKNASLVHTVALALADSGLPATRLELEITESVLLGNSEENVRTLRALKDLGVSISLDDFGTGYSSLGYLRSFPFDRIKIDKSFVHDMCESREAMSIIRAITELSNSLMIKTTAEGVESAEQMERLLAEGCSQFQGYLYGRPAPASERLTQVMPRA
ncbi:EAL domain-containing protein [Pseudomonas mosselii]|uniref:sensor domain-containing protein n=1 Tax=Pseudomonas mosselii TaxID=78327 RepID=UPI00244A84B0|nr:EAL domain-containing protein [Pseudomonas mosselii]MDH1103776.1 EAL domain-containing protein [Pseudomonas mosselii]